jgi:hypothetical protein
METSDVSSFPPVDEDEYLGEGRRLAEGRDLDDVWSSALAAGASEDRWVNQGMVASEYLENR